MRRDPTIQVDDLDRPDGNSLLENYEAHDIGEEVFIARCEERGWTVEAWGIDRRYDDGEGGVLFDDAMDFKIYKDDDLVALVDVKTKTSPEWMGQFNLRHYDDYCDQREEYGVPTFILMYQVDRAYSSVYDSFVFEIGVYNDPILSSRNSDVIRQFPDGNGKAVIKHDYRVTWTDFVKRVEGEL